MGEMANAKQGSIKTVSDSALVERLQSILVNAADGRRNVSDDAQYPNFRRELTRRKLPTPPLVSTHPSVDSFSAFIRGVGSKPERVARVRQEFEAVLQFAATEAARPSGTNASAWTGQRTLREQIAIIRGLAPMAAEEVEALADLVEKRRFNDPMTADAIACLRELHSALGQLIAEVDRGSLTQTALKKIEANRQKLLGLLREGAKMTVVAPAMTLGVINILSWMNGVNTDSTMVAGIYASILGADALKSIGKRTSISG